MIVYFQNSMATRHPTIVRHHPTFRQPQPSTNPSRDAMTSAGCVNYRSRRVSRLRQQHASTAVHVTSKPVRQSNSFVCRDDVGQRASVNRPVTWWRHVSTKTTRSAVNITVLVCSLCSVVPSSHSFICRFSGQLYDYKCEHSAYYCSDDAFVFVYIYLIVHSITAFRWEVLFSVCVYSRRLIFDHKSISFSMPVVFSTVTRKVL